MTANDSPLKIDFPISLGNKEYLLSYPLPAVWAFEDAAGVSVLEPPDADGVDPNASDEEKAAFLAARFNERVFGKGTRQIMQRVVQLLWAGLITHQPKFTIEETGRFVFVRNMNSVREQVMQAFAQSLGAAQAEEQPTQEDGGERPLVETTTV